jgi:hypothetical protein
MARIQEQDDDPIQIKDFYSKDVEGKFLIQQKWKDVSTSAIYLRLKRSENLRLALKSGQCLARRRALSATSAATSSQI